MEVREISRYLLWLYYGILLIVCFTGFYRFKKIDLASKILCLFTVLVFITEITGFYAANKYKTNLPVYSIYGFLEFGMISLYFNYSIDHFKKRNIGIIIGIIGITLGIINTALWQPLNTINSYFIFIEGICIVGMAMFSFFRLLLKNENLRLHNQPHFWFSGILSFYWSATFLNWGLYDYLVSNADKRINLLFMFLIVINILTYLSMEIVFLLYPKMKTQI